MTMKMDDVGIALLAFRGLEFGVALSHHFNLDGAESRSEDACCVTLLELSHDALGEDDWVQALHPAYNSISGGMWAGDSGLAVCTALFEKDTHAPIWIAGEYTLEELPAVDERCRVLDGEITDVRGIGNDHDSQIVMIKVSNMAIEQVPDLLPRRQGWGHHYGARVMQFPGTTSLPEQLRQTLSLRSSTRAIDMGDSVLVSDEVAPAGVRAWCSPYGYENRYNAHLYSTTHTPDDLLSQLSMSLGLPVIVSESSRDEFIQWDRERILPVDVRDCVSDLIRGVAVDRS